MIEIRIIGSFIAIDNREKSRDCPSSSNNPVVSDNRRSDNRNLTVLRYGSMLVNNKVVEVLDTKTACKEGDCVRISLRYCNVSIAVW